MSWNYRVIYHPPSKYMIGKTEFSREEYLAIHEVYYDDDDKTDSWTIDEIMTGDDGIDSLSSLKWILKSMLKALDRPILKETGSRETSTLKLEEIKKEKQNEFSKSINNKE